MADQNQGASIEAERAALQPVLQDLAAERAACALEFGATWERQTPETQMAILSGWLAARRLQVSEIGMAEIARRSVPPAAGGDLPPLPSKKEIDAIVYACRQSGKDTTYDIVHAAIAADRAQRKQAGQVDCLKCEGRGKHAAWSHSAGKMIDVPCGQCGGSGKSGAALQEMIDIGQATHAFTKPPGWVNLLNPGQRWEEWTREQGPPTTKGWKVSGQEGEQPTKNKGEN